jgi:precorrin-3B synthase
MESGDGLIVRVRPHAGTLSMAQLIAIADAGLRYGNGEIDLTRRANLQLRGIRPDTLAGVQDILSSLGLLDRSAEAESVRNILVSPLAGVDARELIDVRSLARVLEQRIGRDERLWVLPPKFGFLLDGGGILSLDAERADIRLRAISAEQFAFGIAGSSGVCWLGRVNASRAVDAALVAALAFASLGAAAPRRMDGVSGEVVEQLSNALKLDALVRPPIARSQGARLGALKGAVGLGAPFGRISAGTLLALCKEAADLGAREMRLSPWRALYILLGDENAAFDEETAAKRLLATAPTLGLITSDDDPLARIDACPGAPACPCAGLDTRKAARALADLWPRLGIASAHVSGCPKGCARSKPADLVLFGGETFFSVVRNGRADGMPEGRVLPSLEGLRDMIHG